MNIYIYIYIYGGVSFVWALETDPQHCATQPSGIYVFLRIDKYNSVE